MPYQMIFSRFALFGLLLTGALASSFATVSIAAEPAAFAWKPLQIPKALVAVGVWGDTFKWREALHHQGIEYDDGYRYQNGYYQPAVQMVNIPTALVDYQKYSTVVLINVDAPALGKERLESIRQFVAQGGGLVVLGGEWAFERGGYLDTPVAEVLPVELNLKHGITQTLAGATLTPNPFFPWKWDADFDLQPRAFFTHDMQVKPKANAILNVGDMPAIVAGEYGKGRAVACSLTVNGIAPEKTLPFWEWSDWPAVLGQTIDWAGANRPLSPPQTTANKTVPIDEDEAEKLRLEFQPLSKEVLARFVAAPTQVAADAIFATVFPESKQKVELTPELVSALAAQAQAEWSPTLLKVADSLNPSLHERNVALELLGATRSPAATKVLLAALTDSDVATGAIAGLRRLDDSAQAAALKRLYERSYASADFRNYGEDTLADTAAGVQGRIAVASAIALYHLGDPAGVARQINLHRQLRLLRRVYFNAAKRRVVETDPTGVALRAAIYKKAVDFSALEQQLLAAAGPIPPTQREAFLDAARAATQPEDVVWLAAALHGESNETDWSALSQASDGIIRRLASAASKKP